VVVGVSSASGGCGVTTVALHLARGYRGCFVERSREVGAAERLGLDRPLLKTWEGGSTSGASLRLAALPIAGGFRALFAPPEGWDVGHVIRAASASFHAVVVDLGAGAPVPDRCDAVVIVMPPTMPGAARARSVLGPGPIPRLLVANRVGPGGELTRTLLQTTAEARIDGVLPCCPALRDAEDDGALVSAHTRWGRHLTKVARALAVMPRASPVAVP
jgi:hypothetical protein